MKIKTERIAQRLDQKTNQKEENQESFLKEVGKMSLILTIPDEVLETIKLPRKKAEGELKKELAFLLYERELASMGVARRLSGMTKWEFIVGLTERGIQRHYGQKELEEDVKYAKSGQ